MACLSNNSFVTFLIIKKIYLYIVVALLFCSACNQSKKEGADTLYEYRLKGIEEYRKANFSFSAAYIYSDENIKIWVNDQLVFDEIGRGNMRWVFYSFPFQINKIEIVSKYNDQIIFRKEYKDTLQDAERVLLNLEIPIPDGRDIGALTFPPDWKHVEIDSGFRPLTLTEDTTNYIIY